MSDSFPFSGEMVKEKGEVEVEKSVLESKFVSMRAVNGRWA